MENKKARIELKPEIYISYAWEKQEDGSNWPPILKNLYKTLIDNGYQVHIDINSLKYKDNIKSFMQDLGKGKYIISIISEKYMKSINCMYEVLQILRYPHYKERVFPILTSDAKIYDSKKILEYLVHWDNEINNLNNEAKALNNIAYAAPIFEDIEIMNDIRRALAQFGNEIGSMNVLTPDIHKATNFKDLLDCIKKKVEVDKNTIDLKIENLSLKEENLKLNNEVKELREKISQFKKLSIEQDKKELNLEDIEQQTPGTVKSFKSESNIIEFKSFLGFTNKNSIEDCIKVLGKPKRISKDKKYNFNTAYFNCNIDITYYKKTNKVMSLRFRSMKGTAKNAIELLKDKGIEDSKIEYLGIHRNKLLKLFGKPSHIYSDNYTYYTNYGFILTFICYEFNDHLCNEIYVHYSSK